MSESPASNTAIVEHLKSFPQAVPNSIYTTVSAFIHSEFLLLFHAAKASGNSTLPHGIYAYDEECSLTLLPAKWWTLVFDSME